MAIRIVTSALKNQMNKTVLCFGDSHTYGFDPHHFSRYLNPWPQILQSLLPACKIYIEGLNGRSIQFDDPMIKGKNGMHALPKILKKHPNMDMIIVMLGTNDLRKVFQASIDDICNGMERMLTYIKEVQPNATILLIAPPPLRKEVPYSMWKCDFDDTCYQASLQLSKRYEDLAKTCACLYLDAGKYVEASPYDCVHMSEASHEVFAHVLYEQFFSRKEKG